MVVSLINVTDRVMDSGPEIDEFEEPTTGIVKDVKFFVSKHIESSIREACMSLLACSSLELLLLDCWFPSPARL